MKNTIKIGIFLALILGPSMYAFADETSSDSNLTVQASADSPVISNNDSKPQEDIEDKTKAEEDAKCPPSAKIAKADKSTQIEEKTTETPSNNLSVNKENDQPQASVASVEKAQRDNNTQPEVVVSEQRDTRESARSVRSLRNKACHGYINPYMNKVHSVAAKEDRNQSTMQAEIEAARPKLNEDTRDIRSKYNQGFVSNINDAKKEIAKSHVDVINSSHSDDVRNVRVNPTGSFTSNIQSAVQVAQTGNLVGVRQNASDELRFRDRDLRERELRRREWELRERENRLRHREFRFSEQDRAYRDREWCDRQLRLLEWQDIAARDAELRYLIWRERQMSKYYWLQNGRICRYVTVYKTGFRVNKRVTVCEIRHGLRVCYHPKRYFIFPITKLICEQNIKPMLRTVVHPYDY